MIMKKILIYGIGTIGKEFIDYCMSKGTWDFVLVDSDSSLWGTEYKGMKISSPKEIQEQEYSFIVITAGEKYRWEIFHQLVTAYKQPKEKISFFEEIVILEKDEQYNWGNVRFCESADGLRFTSGREIGSLLAADSMNDLEKFFFKNEHRPICKLMHYFEAYDRFFSKYRGKDIKILEIGVSRGGSLQMWKDYFKTSGNHVQVYGIDIDPDCRALEEENIKIFIGSQEDREFLRKVKSEAGEVDILIDDGGHTMNQQITTFEELFDMVSDSGIYLCEDLHTSYMKRFGGGYRGKTFIEYSKNLIDYLHMQYFETDELPESRYSGRIKYITYCDSMVFIEKQKKMTKSLVLRI